MKKKSSAPKPCKFDGRFFKPCKLMDLMLDETNSRSKGISILELTNFETLRVWHVGVALRTKEKPNGLMLNYCPWCAAEIRPRESEPAAK